MNYPEHLLLHSVTWVGTISYTIKYGSSAAATERKLAQYFQFGHHSRGKKTKYEEKRERAGIRSESLASVSFEPKRHPAAQVELIDR